MSDPRRISGPRPDHGRSTAALNDNTRLEILA